MAFIREALHSAQEASSSDGAADPKRRVGSRIKRAADTLRAKGYPITSSMEAVAREDQRSTSSTEGAVAALLRELAAVLASEVASESGLFFGGCEWHEARSAVSDLTSFGEMLRRAFMTLSSCKKSAGVQAA